MREMRDRISVVVDNFSKKENFFIQKVCTFGKNAVPLWA